MDYFLAFSAAGWGLFSGSRVQWSHAPPEALGRYRSDQRPSPPCHQVLDGGSHWWETGVWTAGKHCLTTPWNGIMNTGHRLGGGGWSSCDDSCAFFNLASYGRLKGKNMVDGKWYLVSLKPEENFLQTNTFNELMLLGRIWIQNNKMINVG